MRNFQIRFELSDLSSGSASASGTGSLDSSEFFLFFEVYLSYGHKNM